MTDTGAIIMDNHGAVILVAIGDYEKLKEQLPLYKGMAGGMSVKCIDVSSIDINYIRRSQELIQAQLSKYL